MPEEAFRGPKGDRTAWRLPATAWANPSGFKEDVERPLRGRDAADVLDLRARHGLMIGDDRERLDGRPRQFLGLDRIAGEQPGQIVGGAKRPLSRDPHEI